MPRSRQVKSTAPSPSPRLMDEAKGKEAEPVEAADVAEEGVDGENGNEDGAVADGEDGGAEAEDGGEEGGEADAAATTMADRQAKLRELRLRMSQSTAANRRDLVADHQKSRVSAKEIARLEKQRKLAQTLRTKADAEASGADVERQKAWEWSIEQNERWEAKIEESKAKQDQRYHNAEDDAHKRYMRNIRNTKADLTGYARQKEIALGLAPSSGAVAGPSTGGGVVRATGLSGEEDFYRGAETLSYGDSKPSEDAVDRVISKINKDMGKKKRNRKDDDEDEQITYINKSNKVFNKKAARYFDKYTKEIKASLERGTAL